MHADALAIEALFPHAASFDHFQPELHREGGNDGLVKLVEHLPFVSSGLQIMHEFSGDHEALARARKADPLGSDGVLTHAAEYVPLVNSIVQTVHHAGENDEALQRARARDPIGSQGYVTKALEHIPGLSDTMVRYHRLREDEEAAERARHYSLERLFSRDGPITRVAELVPGSNLLAAGMHIMNGDTERCARALDVFASWGELSSPDFSLWQVAELVPGADALAFAMHLHRGHYAQALRSVTKTSWVKVSAQELVFFIRTERLRGLFCHKVDIDEVDVIPRQLSLVVGFSDLAANFLRMDPQGQLRHLREEPSGETRHMAVDLSKELVKEVINEFLANRVNYLAQMVPLYQDWLLEFLNDYLLPKYRQESLSWRLLPAWMPPLTYLEKQESQIAFPAITVRHERLEPPEVLQLKRRRPPLATCSCWSLAALAGLCGGAKVGAVSCAAGCLAAAFDLATSFVRTALSSFGEGNARRWHEVVVEPQPRQSWSSASDTGGSGSGTVCELSGDALERLSPHLCDYLRRAVSQQLGFWPSLRRRWLFSTVHGATDVVPLVVPVDLDPFEVPLEDYSFDLSFPSMRFALELHLEISQTSCRVARLFASLPDELVLNVARGLQEQMQGWDLREMDLRFSGFTRPVHMSCELQLDWSDGAELRVTTRKLSSRLDLPAS